MSQTVEIASRPVGAGHPPYVVTELSANHLGSLERAFAVMEASKQAGADAIKLQTYTADTITIDHDGPGFRIEGGLWDGRSLYELYEEAHTPWDWHAELFAKGRELDLTVFSSPFDATAVDFLERFDPPAYKIASFECIDLPLIARTAATGKPLIISTGMADQSEIGDAVAAARQAGSGGVVLLHCVSAYPAPADEANLRTIADLAGKFDLPVGLSDHTLGTAVSVAATTLGAAMIEKHLTLSRADGGPDAEFSLEPNELRKLVDDCRTAFSSLGQASYQRTSSETANAAFRRSLYVVADIEKGEPFTEANVRSIRPGFGLPPKLLESVLGCRARCTLKRGAPLDEDAVEWGAGRKP